MSLAIFGVIIAISVIAICIGRRVEVSEKTKKKLNNLEDQLFYNPFIRISLLSGLKANLTSNLVFMLLRDNKYQMIPAVMIFSLNNLVPLWYARVLSKQSTKLTNEY